MNRGSALNIYRLLSANLLIHIDKIGKNDNFWVKNDNFLVQNDNFLVKYGLLIGKFRIRGPKWRNISTANNEGNLAVVEFVILNKKEVVCIKFGGGGLHISILTWK